MVAGELAEICARNSVGFIFKGSFDKTNRTSIDAERGVGIDAGLEISRLVQARIGCPVLTDVHTVEQCTQVAHTVDILQIPAFLSRQTDLLVAAGETGKVVNVKKGQFLAPNDMAYVAQKVASTGDDKVMLCERWTSFGYNTLVTDMRALPQMARTGYPVIIDASHSVQQPGSDAGASGGQREFIPIIAWAAVAVCVAGVFIETHESPTQAPSDGANVVPLSEMPQIVGSLKAFDLLAKANPVGIE